MTTQEIFDSLIESFKSDIEAGKTNNISKISSYSYEIADGDLRFTFYFGSNNLFVNNPTKLPDDYCKETLLPILKEADERSKAERIAKLEEEIAKIKAE